MTGRDRATTAVTRARCIRKIIRAPCGGHYVIACARGTARASAPPLFGCFARPVIDAALATENRTVSPHPPGVSSPFSTRPPRIKVSAAAYSDIRVASAVAARPTSAATEVRERFRTSADATADTTSAELAAASASQHNSEGSPSIHHNAVFHYQLTAYTDTHAPSSAATMRLVF